MKKTKTLFIATGLSFVVLSGGYMLHNHMARVNEPVYEFNANKYGAFLAASHAILNHDFENAAKYADELQDTEIKVVGNVLLLSEFLNGTMPQNAESLGDEDSSSEQFIYDLYLAKNDKWEELYARHKNDETAILSPIRIWSGVATNYITKTLQFIDGLSVNESWKNFVKGQIYAELGKPERAAEFFKKVEISFLNINDFLYLTAFYNHFEMNEAGTELYQKFTERPGGMFILNMDVTPNWADFTGYQNAMAFSLTQNISHTQIMMHSDLSLILLRFAEILQNSTDKNAINYYLGQYFLNNGDNYDKYMKAIEPGSLFYSYARMNIAEKSGSIQDLNEVLESNPLFLPAVQAISAKYTQNGKKSSALKVIDNAIADDDLTEMGRSYLYKLRSDVNIAFKEYSDAQKDLDAATEVLGQSAETLSNQIKIWAHRHENVNEAYSTAVILISKNPLETRYWNSLARIVWVNEGVNEALEVAKSVTDVTEINSDIFETLGDMYVEKGDFVAARDAYNTAIKLSGDGLSVIPDLKKKLRKIK